MLPLMATRLFCLYSFSNFPLNFVNNEKEKTGMARTRGGCNSLLCFVCPFWNNIGASSFLKVRESCFHFCRGLRHPSGGGYGLFSHIMEMDPLYRRVTKKSRVCLGQRSVFSVQTVRLWSKVAAIARTTIAAWHQLAQPALLFQLHTFRIDRSCTSLF